MMIVHEKSHQRDCEESKMTILLDSLFLINTTYGSEVKKNLIYNVFRSKSF